MTKVHEPAPITDQEAKEAAQAAETLAELVKTAPQGPTRVRVSPDGVGEDVPVVLPKAALRLLVDLLNEMAKGNAITLVPIHAELTTQEAADLLNVSRPYLIKLLEEGKIPFRKVGTRRKVSFRELMGYKHRDDAERLKIADQLTAEAEEIGLEY